MEVRVSIFHVHTIGSEHRDPLLCMVLPEVPRKGEYVLIPLPNKPEGQSFVVCSVVWRAFRSPTAILRTSVYLDAEILVRDLSPEEFRRSLTNDSNSHRDRVL